MKLIELFAAFLGAICGLAMRLIDWTLGRRRTFFD
jgi:hypothetical protein